MSNKCIITGTDTSVGKTVFAAALMLALNEYNQEASYWKPVQAGVQGGVDTKEVQRLTMLPAERFYPESYVLSQPLSPHRAAELDKVEIDPDKLDIPEHDGPLLIEGAGGLNVPLTRTTLLSDVFAMWKLPVILCARTGLGTINHTLLSIEALYKRDIPIYGIVFIGDENEDNMKTIGQFSEGKILGRLPWLETLNAETLLKAFNENFNIEDFG